MSDERTIEGLLRGPWNNPGSERTADALAASFAVRGLYHFSRLMSFDLPVDFVAARAQMMSCHDLVLCLRALEAVDEAAANRVAEQLISAAEAGDSYGEWLWQWVDGLGLDPDAVNFEARSKLEGQS